MALPVLTNAQIIDQLDFEDGSFAYEWVGSTITYKFPASAAETTSYDFDVDPIGDPGPEAGEFTPLDAATAALFRIAIQAWDDLVAVNFVEKTSPGEADVEAAFTTDGIHFAHAYYPEDAAGSASSTGGTVWLNRDYDTDGDPNDLVAAPIGSYGFNTYLHELGHAIGLDHMGDYSPSNPGPFSFQDTTVHSVMSYFGPAGPDESNLVQQADWTVGGETYDAQTPMMSDVLAIQSIYGVSTTTRTGNTTYGFNATGLGSMAVIFDFTQNLHPVVCIFDSAGTDTLDLSGFSGNNVISLVSGTLSSASNAGTGTMTNNVSIAHSATIENAVGGSGNDRITGNATANVLTGGGGHDTIEGGLGDDSLAGGAGNDLLDGGGGTDVAVFGAALASYTFTLDVLASAWTFVSGATGTDTVRDVELFEFADGVKTLAELLGTDLTGPALTGSTPADGATGVGRGGLLTLTFDEPVRAGSGVITYHTQDGAVVHTVHVSDGSQVSFSGSTVTVEPSVVFAYGTAYYVNVAAGAIEDEGGRAFTGIGGSSALDFTIEADPVVVVAGTDADDVLTGTASVEVIRGFGGKDTLRGNGGNDTLEGGEGLDTAVFGGAREDYDLDIGATLTIEATSGGDGTDTATGIERLRFSDQGLALDLDGNAGVVARTLGAVFGGEFVTSAGYVKAGLEIVDGGMDFETVMGLALGLRLGPSATHADVVQLLYTNVVGTSPSDAELQAFAGLLDSGTFTRAGLGVYAAQTVFNELNIGLAGLSANGLAFDL